MTKKSIEVVCYDPNWPRLFEIEAATLNKTLNSNCIDIHHIGSTAIPGLIAKAKIDIIAVVKDYKDAINTLEKNNYNYKGEYNIPLRYFLTKRGEVNINLHLYEKEHPEIELNLLFRDYLRSSPLAKDEYAALKQHILSDQSAYEKTNFPFTNYTLRKGDFIREILAKAGFNSLRMLKCNDEIEWAYARNIHAKYFLNRDNIEDSNVSIFNHSNHEHLILYEGTTIIGYAYLQVLFDEKVAIRIFDIEESKSNNNFGNIFLGWCEKWLKSKNYTISKYTLAKVI